MIKNKFCLQFMMVVMVLNLETFNVHSGLIEQAKLPMPAHTQVALSRFNFCSFCPRQFNDSEMLFLDQFSNTRLRFQRFVSAARPTPYHRLQRKCQRTLLLTLYQNIYRCSFKKIFIAVDIFLKLRSFILLKNIITNL
jgi:hypothetical protein